MIRAMLPWGSDDIPLLVILPIAALLSAAFSGSETALFGLRAHERRDLIEQGDAVSRAAATLLANPRMLLITLLLGNMTVNVVYFVVSSVLLLRIDPTTASPALGFAASVVLLAIIILFGEVMPKLVAARHSRTWVRLATVPLVGLHGFLAPIRLPLSRFIIEPLIRLGVTPGRLLAISHDELDSLLEISRDADVIDRDEYELLSDIVRLSRQTTRDIMTPRIRMGAFPVDVDRVQLLDEARESRLPRVPIYEGSIDTIVGVLNLRRFLLDDSLTIRKAMEPPSFVPELATLDRLLDHFRTTQTRLAMVVDEFGQTTGLVTLDDVMSELYGRAAEHETDEHIVMLIGIGRWILDGDLNIHDFADAFTIEIKSPRVSTVAGLVSHELRRVPKVGDSVVVGAYRLIVRTVRRSRAVSIEVEALA